MDILSVISAPVGCKEIAQRVAKEAIAMPGDERKNLIDSVNSMLAEIQKESKEIMRPYQDGPSYMVPSSVSKKIAEVCEKICKLNYVRKALSFPQLFV